ncbi:iron complex transport system substrate-binding protein [Allocatelliglobosispora scoriae]|uniref:Iron complex transport system substrate-binding protein n=1 Tax=Allocatelliglobosispora scoriae TaxID=643052 RepID=A0A841C1B5_9ACTN|nr:ABC transporter substrate-binding protein [Allocatelliglobosispora scoriae]MBB5874154.1 iron complex transport system substrate-binding protein [Allocatelliglobosispora scoriae]
MGQHIGRLATAALLAVALTACGGQGDDTATPAPSAGAAFPVTIEHKFGATTIPARPGKVVTVGWNDQDFALAVGVVPVSTREWFTEYPTYPWVQPKLGGKPLPAFSAELNYEAIAQAQPDLIIAIYETVTRQIYDRLSQIAPTVIQAAAYQDEQTPWHVQALTVGTALGKQAEAQALVDKVNAKIAAVKQAHPEFAGKTLVVDYGPDQGQHWLIGAGDPRRSLFDALGFATQDTADEISEERLDLIDHDALLVIGATKAAMLKSPVFSALKVVQTDRTLYTAFETPLAGALSYSGPEALLYALDVLVPQLANALDMNPATPVADLSAIS